MDVLAALAEFDASLPDGQLVALADSPGVERSSIRIACTPYRSGRGRHAVTWRQDGRNCSAEGSTLGIALGRAVRAAGGESAHVNTTGEGHDGV